ncbi:cyclase family protein [Candidatus Uhrbacteria bacterium]|nr:cyclase family protein [Candidatus Uhrbacteria bacterium]
MPRWIDISLPLTTTLVHWPGQQGLRVRALESIKKDGVEVHDIALSTHTGTHIDAPRHFVAGTRSVDEIDLEKFIGPAVVIAVRPKNRWEIQPSDLPIRSWKGVERLFFQTGDSKKLHQKEFTSHYYSLAVDTAALLVRKGVKLVGVDYLSVERKGNPGHPVHKTLLKAGIVIIEGCDLRMVKPGVYDSIALPLRLKGLDGSPARVLLRKRP